MLVCPRKPVDFDAFDEQPGHTAFLLLRPAVIHVEPTVTKSEHGS